MSQWLTTKHRLIPEWLQPHKSKWCGVQGLGKYFQVRGQSPQTFIKAYGQTLRPKRVDTPQGPAKLYLIKHVVACAWAHGFEIEPPRPTKEQATYSQLLEDSKRAQGLAVVVAGLKREIAELRDRIDAGESRLDELVKVIQLLPEKRNARGVYFVIDGDQVAYVGSADNVGKRLDHKASRLLKVRVLPLPAPIDHRAIERAFIRLLRPQLNELHNPERGAKPLCS